MTAHLSLPPHLQPSSKTSPTAKTTHLLAGANSTPTTSRSSSQARPLKPRQNANSPEYTSEKATTSLIRRVLGTQTGVDPRSTPRPIEDILPPLTSSNEVDLQLYAIIAIVVKDFVQSWYSQITPDHAFVEEIIQIIAHSSRAIEQRLRRIDVEELVFDEIPSLVEAHILGNVAWGSQEPSFVKRRLTESKAYRTAHDTVSPSAYHSIPLRIYHSLNPHPALSPFPDADLPRVQQAQIRNDTIYRQLLVQGALAVLLPTEDLQNSCLRTLVSDVIADLILGQGISAKACEGWFLHETIIRLVDVIKSRIEPKARGEEIERDTRSRLEKFGLLSTKVQASPSHSSNHNQSRASALFWRLLQYAYLSVLLVHFVVVGLFRVRSLPSRSQSSRLVPPSPISGKATRPSTLSQSWLTLAPPSQRPILEYRLFPLVPTLLDLSTRMPWLTGLLSLCRHGILIGPGRLGAADGLLDKFLHNTLTTHITPWPTLLPIILLNLRIALFPYNNRGPPAPTPPSTEEQLRIRRRAAEAILTLVPKPVARVYFAVKYDDDDRADKEDDTDDDEGREFGEMILQIEEGILDVFGNSYLNKHLVYNILELVLVRLVPELGESGVADLLAERGVMVADKYSDVDGGDDGDDHHDAEDVEEDVAGSEEVKEG